MANPYLLRKHSFQSNGTSETWFEKVNDHSGFNIFSL